MAVLDGVLAQAGAGDLRVVMPEMDEDDRVSEAARQLSSRGLCSPLPLAPVTDDLVAALVSVRGVREAIARRLLARPLFRGAAMVAAGQADAMVAGAASPTRRVIEAAAMAIGLAEGVSAPSSFFLMVFPDGREMIFADCAVNVAPDAAQLADIARASAASGEALRGAARGALFSFSTGNSGGGAGVAGRGATGDGLAGPGRLRRSGRLGRGLLGSASVAGTVPG